MNILFVTPYPPSPVRIRPYALIRELARQGHAVTLACLVQPRREAGYLQQVERYCQNVHAILPGRFGPLLRGLASLPTREPLSVAYCRSAALGERVRQLAQADGYDVIHTEFVRAVPATAELSSHPKVFDAVDSLALAHRRSLTAAHVPARQRLVSLLEWLKLRRYEPSVLGQYDHVMVSSPEDKKQLSAFSVRCSAARQHSAVSPQLSEAGDRSFRAERRQPTADSPPPITVLPNGVDLEYFNFREGAREAETLVFLGKMSYYVNIASVLWFYRQVLPLIQAERPEVRLRIAGREPAPAIAALAQDPAVEVTGELPDVRPAVAGAAVNVCPMVSGSGIQNKLLEAMALGTPSVATPIAVQALSAQPGEHLLVGETAVQFAAAVLRLLDDPALHARLSQGGRRYVECCHDWPAIGRQLTGVYRQVLN